MNFIMIGLLLGEALVRLRVRLNMYLVIILRLMCTVKKTWCGLLSAILTSCMWLVYPASRMIPPAVSLIAVIIDPLSHRWDLFRANLYKWRPVTPEFGERGVETTIYVALFVDICPITKFYGGLRSYRWSAYSGL